MQQREFSIFNKPIINTTPSGKANIQQVYERIIGEEFKGIIHEIQNCDQKQAKQDLKAKKLDFVTFSGLFGQRNRDGLQSHSGLLCFDFDNFDNMDELRMAKEALRDEKELETELLFTSPSGLGLKWIISDNRINETTHHKFFKAISNMLKARYKLEVDPSGKDIPRACFLTHDPSAFINPKHLENDIH